MNHYTPERTSDPIMAILIRCHAEMPHATLREKARWCLEKQRELQRDGKVATVPGEVVPFPRLVETDPIMARLCGQHE